MKKTILSIITFLAAVPICTAIAFASADDTLRVGLYYDGSGSNGALISANLENYVGAGYQFGYYDAERNFVKLGETDETRISMSQDLNLYVQSDGSYTTSAVNGVPVIGCHHLQLTQTFPSYDEASAKAEELEHSFDMAFPVYDHGVFAVRVGSFLSAADAQEALQDAGLSAEVNSGSAYTVTVTKSCTDEILFEYDDGGDTFLGVMPKAASGEKAETWFKGYRYYGGFEYDRSAKLSGGRINVINVVDVEDYVKGVVPFEMSPSWPTEALKAQAVCARTYALCQSKHRSRNFDVCATTNCQVYHGSSGSHEGSDLAVDATAGLKLYYDGKLIEPPYYSSNGGASENSENVWSAALPYLRGKQDPYENADLIPNYAYEKTYTGADLGARLRKRNFNIGTVIAVQPTYTEQGNILSIVFTDEAGNTAEVKKEACRLMLGTPSMRFTISESTVSPSGDGTNRSLSGFFSSIGKVLHQPVKEIHQRSPLEQLLLEKSGAGTSDPSQTAAANVFVVRGTGSGHNVGMSQYGAYAYAKQGGTFEDILHFYYTGVTIQ